MGSTVESAFLALIAASVEESAAGAWGEYSAANVGAVVVWSQSNIRLGLKRGKALTALLQLAPWHSLLGRDPNGLRLAEFF